MTDNALKELGDIIENIEVDRVGIASLEDRPESPLGTQARRLLPGARSVIVLALEVFLEVVDHLTSKAQVGEIMLRTLYRGNTDIVNGRLNWEAYRLVKKLHNYNYKGIPLPASESPLDGRYLEPALSYKHAAEIAGLGVSGWHSMLLTPEYGPRVRLSCVVTDAPLEISAPLKWEKPCLQCNGACAKICPPGAIIEPQGEEPYRIDKYLCNNYIVASGGCAECVRVCPAGR